MAFRYIPQGKYSEIPLKVIALQRTVAELLVSLEGWGDPADTERWELGKQWSYPERSTWSSLLVAKDEAKNRVLHEVTPFLKSAHILCIWWSSYGSLNTNQPPASLTRIIWQLVKGHTTTLFLVTSTGTASNGRVLWHHTATNPT